MKELKGVIIPAVTPFDKNQKIDFRAISANLEQWNKTAVQGYMALGSNGEFRSLDDGESLQVLQCFAENRAPDKILIAGVARESLFHTLGFIDRLFTAGIELDYVSVLPPHYFKSLMTDEALFGYFTAIADRSPYPVLLYCAPSFSNDVCLSAPLVQKLADHPNIYGIKDTSPHMMDAYIGAAGGRRDFTIMAGSVKNVMSCLKQGGAGGVLSAANYFPQECAELYLSFQEQGFSIAQEKHEKLSRIIKLTGGRGGIAGVKCCMNLLGFQGGIPRLPILPMKKEIEEEIKKALAERD